MAIDVFVSYKREQRDLAEKVVAHLRGAGFTAVTDLNIGRNEDFGDAIDRMIRTARATLVLWTLASATSDWVRQEALLAKKLEKEGKPNAYVGVMVEPLGSAMHVTLMNDNMLDLTAGGLDAAGLERIRIAVEQAIDRKPTLAPAVATVQSQDVARELDMYQTVTAIDDVGSYQMYLTAYPAGTFAKEARLRQAQARRWYLHPLRRKNLSNTISVVAVTLAVATFALDRMRPDDPLILGIAPETHRAVEAERDAARAAAQAETAKAGAATSSARAAEGQVTELQGKLARAEADLKAAKAAKDADAVAPPTDCFEKGEAGYDFAGTCVPLTATNVSLGYKKALTDVSRLKFLPAITALDLSGTGVSDLSPIAGLKDLSYLNLGFTDIEDISVLAELSNLGLVNLPRTQVRSIAPLSDKPELFSLFLSGTNVTDLSELKFCPKLRFIYLDNTRPKSLAPLLACPLLEQLTTPDGKQHKGRDAVLAAIRAYKP